MLNWIYYETRNIPFKARMLFAKAGRVELQEREGLTPSPYPKNNTIFDKTVHVICVVPFDLC